MLITPDVEKPVTPAPPHPRRRRRLGVVGVRFGVERHRRARLGALEGVVVAHVRDGLLTAGVVL